MDRSVCYLAAEQRRCFGGAMAEDLRARVQALAGGFDLVALRCRVQADIDALRQKGMLK